MKNPDVKLEVIVRSGGVTGLADENAIAWREAARQSGFKAISKQSGRWKRGAPVRGAGLRRSRHGATCSVSAIGPF